MCGCEEGYTEVMTSDGLLDQCTLIPVLEIPTAGDNRADVKTIRAFSPTQPEVSAPGRAGRTWFLQPFGPGGSQIRSNGFDKRGNLQKQREPVKGLRENKRTKIKTQGQKSNSVMFLET